MRPVDVSMLQYVSPSEWQKQPHNVGQTVSTHLDRNTVEAYLAGYMSHPSQDSTVIATYGAAEHLLVAWIDRCVQGGIKWCDIWEMMSYGAHQIITKDQSRR